MNLKTILKWRVIHALKIWNRAPLRAQGGILALIPIIAVIVSFIFALYGNSERAKIEYDIQRRFRLVRQYNDLLALMVDAETSERGYLLTKRQEYLEPYQKVTSEIPRLISGLKQTIGEEPGDKPREERMQSLTAVEDLIGKELDLIKSTRNAAGQLDNSENLAAHLAVGKRLMDQIRESLYQMESRDGELLRERIQEINSIRKRDYITVFIVLGVGLLTRLVSFYLFDRGIVRRVNRLTEYVKQIGSNTKLNFDAAKKDDAIGILEQEIVKIAEQKNH